MKKITMLLVILTFLGLQVIQAQKRTVSGTVTSDDDNAPLPGVSIVEKGTTNGVVTDINGKYSISVDGKVSLIFTFVGMSPKEIVTENSTSINVVMSATEVGIDEVVITAMGISREKKSLGYSVQDIGGDELSKNKEANIVNSLSGQISGIQVTSSSGAVGASSRIVIRGATSITGNNEPLFVVDGVPINNTNYGTATDGGGFDTPSGSADINPDDIETISVLKGANAAALYGSRAANGVILIKTKTGNKGQGLGVSVNSTVTFEQPFILPDFQNTYGQGASHSFFEFQDGTHCSAGVDESWGMPLDIGLDAVQFTTNGQTPEPWVSVPDNVKNFYDTGVTHSTNVSLSGSTNKVGYRLSFTNFNQTGIVPNTELGKITINGSANAELTEKLYTSLSVNYIKTSSDNLPTIGYTNENPVQQMIWAGRQVNFDKLRN